MDSPDEADSDDDADDAIAEEAEAALPAPNEAHGRARLVLMTRLMTASLWECLQEPAHPNHPLIQTLLLLFQKPSTSSTKEVATCLRKPDFLTYN